MRKYKKNDVVRFHNKLYPTWDGELFLIERAYEEHDGTISYGARPLIPIGKLEALISSGKISLQSATYPMFVHSHELSPV